MAAASSLQSLQEEATCPICLEYFTDPVSVECGHSFCKACISQCWEGSDTDVSCPQCRETVLQRNLRPNKQLASMVEIAQRMSIQPAKETGGEVCGEHKEALKLFCDADQTPICVVCHLSRAHRGHTIIPVEEAAQEYKEKIQARLETLWKGKEKLLGFKAAEEEKSQKYLKRIEEERKKIVSEFEQLQQFLEEQKQHLLAQLEELNKAMVNTQDENITKVSGEISRVNELISELEEKCQKPANEFLQDIRNILISCEKGKVQQPEKISPELETSLSDFSYKTVALMETLKTFKDTLPSALERTRGQSPGSFPQVTVTLDPDTAHPDLELSEGGRSVRRENTQKNPCVKQGNTGQNACGGWQDPYAKQIILRQNLFLGLGNTCQNSCVEQGNTRRHLPNNPERFDTMLWVLGREGFTWGRHCWEVEVGNGQRWAVGVARQSIKRKGQINLSTEEGIWAVGWEGGQFQALSTPRTFLPHIFVLSRIQVRLDCDQKQVTFFDAVNWAPIFTFPPGSVHGGRICPWLYVEEGYKLRLCP